MSNKVLSLTILVTKSVLGPDTASTILSVHRVFESIATSKFTKFPGDILVAQQSRGHARPKSEDNKGEEVAHGQSPPTSSV